MLAETQLWCRCSVSCHRHPRSSCSRTGVYYCCFILPYVLCRRRWFCCYILSYNLSYLMNRSATFAHLEVDGCEGEDRRTVSTTFRYRNVVLKKLYCKWSGPGCSVLCDPRPSKTTRITDPETFANLSTLRCISRSASAYLSLSFCSRRSSLRVILYTPFVKLRNVLAFQEFLSPGFEAFLLRP